MPGSSLLLCQRQEGNAMQKRFSEESAVRQVQQSAPGKVSRAYCLQGCGVRTANVRQRQTQYFGHCQRQTQVWLVRTNLRIMSHVFKSDTNVQTNYRMPITQHTHDFQCNKITCVDPQDTKKMLLLCQRAMKQMTGYFGGYISKKQKIGQFELKKSIGALPLLQQKLQAKSTLQASQQLAHVCN